VSIVYDRWQEKSLKVNHKSRENSETRARNVGETAYDIWREASRLKVVWQVA